MKTCVVTFFLIFTTNEASIKWELKTTPLVIGEEARLLCNNYDCPPQNTRRWLGGKQYDLLCFDGHSKTPSKYDMTSNVTSFDLMIKNFTFTDLNCEYTCACGFQQYTKMLKVNAEELIYPPRLQKTSLIKKDGEFHLDALIEVHPSPKCNLFFKEEVLQANISVQKTSVEVDLTLFEVAIQHTFEQGDSISKGYITLNCNVGSNAYSVLLYKPYSVEDENKPKLSIIRIIGSVIGIVLIIAFVAITSTIKLRRGKNRGNNKKSTTGKDVRRNFCMVLTRRKDNIHGDH